MKADKGEHKHSGEPNWIGEVQPEYFRISYIQERNDETVQKGIHSGFSHVTSSHHKPWKYIAFPGAVKRYWPFGLSEEHKKSALQGKCKEKNYLMDKTVNFYKSFISKLGRSTEIEWIHK